MFKLLRRASRRNLRQKSTNSKSKDCSRVFLFPGQGSQYVGMCQRFKNEPWIHSLFDRVSNNVGFDLLDMCVNGPAEQLQKTVNCQLAVVLSSLASVEWCRYHGELNDSKHHLKESNVCATAGFSVGEFAALVFAKALSLDNAVKVIQCRAKAMQEASEKHPSGMATLKGLNEQQINDVCESASQAVQSSGSVATIANYLYPKGHVIAGTNDVIDYLLQFAQTKHGVSSVNKLPVSGAFHTQLMSSAQPIVAEMLNTVNVNEPEIPVYSNVTGKSFQSAEQIKMLLVEQIVQPVQWQSIILNIIKDCNPDQFYEVGPGRQLNAILCQIDARYRRHCRNIQA